MTVDIQLSNLQKKTEVFRTSFRVSVGIKDDIIIGNHTFKDLHLIDTFRHLFTNENRHSTYNEIDNQVISPVESPIHLIEHEDPFSKAFSMKTGSGRDKKNPTDAPRRSTRIASPTDKSPTME